MARILVTLSYDNTSVDYWCNTPWNPDDHEAMADDLGHEISLALGDLCKHLVRRRKVANDNAARQMAESQRGCEHPISGWKLSGGRRVCAKCNAYLD